MISSHFVRLLALLSIATACDTRPIATNAEGGSPGGGQAPSLGDDAVILALRAGETVALDERLARAIERDLQRARSLQGIFAEIHAHPYRVPTAVMVWVDDPAVRAAWGSGRIATGVTALDELLASLGPTRVEPIASTAFAVHFDRPVKADLVELLLQQTAAVHAGLPSSAPADDIRLDAAGQQLVFERRWCDCFSGCLYQHRWRVDLPDRGPARVVEEEGDPLQRACRLTSEARQ